MKNLIIAFWNICDMLAGDVDKPACAHAFIIAADELKQLDPDNEWSGSADYQQAVETVKAEKVAA